MNVKSISHVSCPYTWYMFKRLRSSF